MCYWVSLIIFMATSLFSPTVFAQSSYEKKTLTVEDSIKMVKIIEPNASLTAYYPSSVKMSPDGKYFIIITRTGNLTTGNNDYNLILYRSDQVRAFINEPHSIASKLKTEMPEGEILARASSSRNESVFQKIIWLKDSHSLAFIGWFDAKEDPVPGQVYRLDIQSRALNKLTNHTRPITDFEISAVGKKIVFASTVPKNNEDSDKASYLVGVRYIEQITNQNSEYYIPALQYYVQDMDKANHSRPIGELYHSSFIPLIRISPDGRHVILHTASKKVPAHWMVNYQYLKSDFFKRALRDFDDNTMRRRTGLAPQFSLADLSTGNIKPVLDAPTGLFVGGYGVDAHWLPDSKSIILANTALPLDVADKKERKRRSHMFSTVEYNVVTGHITPVTNHRLRKHYRKSDTLVPSGGHFKGLKMDNSGTLVIEERDDSWQELPNKTFIKKDGMWIKISKSNAKHDNRLDISVYQDMETSPEILALDRSTGAEKIITDLNPQFRSLTFGKTNVIKWTDQNGRNWQGGLVYPPNFKKGKKYPLVIQTHGFDPKDFLIDGQHGVTSAFAAQALANRGIMVLQMSDPLNQDKNERFDTQSGFEAAIDHLAALGLIDRGKVGLIGWSSTGVLVQHMLLYSDYPIAAATIADSYNIGLGSYSVRFGAPAPGMAKAEMMHDGAVPWGISLNTWVGSDPTFHLDRLKTPLRYEQYVSNPFDWWETYTILKRQNKPVEYYVFNDSSHVLVKPEHRKASQQGNVDWFTFWLKGEEDNDSAKADQYKRWRKLHIQQEESVVAATKARMRDRNMETDLLK